MSQRTWQAFSRSLSSSAAVRGERAAFITASSRFGLSQHNVSPLHSGLHLRSPAHSGQFFSTTSCFQKKKQKGSDADQNTPKGGSKGTSSAESEDPFDFSSLESDLSTAIDRLKHSLSQLRTGGRFNPASIESLRVATDKDSKTTYPLREVAQVVPRGGRELHLLVGEAGHVKAVSSAVLGSGLNLAPQPDPTGQNPNLLVVRIPPPTAESRKQVVEAAGKAGTVGADAVRNARAAQQKKFRKMELGKVVRPDDLKKASAKMEEVVRKKGEEIKKIVDAAKKALDA